jgi:hypothetical protein
MGSSQAVVRGGVCCLHRWDNLAKVMFAQGQAEGVAFSYGIIHAR